MGQTHTTNRCRCRCTSVTTNSIGRKRNKRTSISRIKIKRFNPTLAHAQAPTRVLEKFSGTQQPLKQNLQFKKQVKPIRNMASNRHTRKVYSQVHKSSAHIAA